MKFNKKISGLMLLALLVSACNNVGTSSSNKFSSSSIIPSVSTNSSNSVSSESSSDNNSTTSSNVSSDAKVSSTTSSSVSTPSVSTPAPSVSTPAPSVSTPAPSVSTPVPSVSTPVPSVPSNPGTVNNNLYAADLESNAPDYYESVKGLKGKALKDALHELIDDHKTYAYNGTMNTYMKDYDQDPNNSNNIMLVYTGSTLKSTSFNKEHVWAKSHGDFGTSQGAGSDMHNLRPCYEQLNSKRSNYDFAEGGSDLSSMNTLYKGNYFSGSTFEPRDDFKGDVARTIFYMATRYDDSSLDLEVESPTNKSKYNDFSSGAKGVHGNFDDLYKWATNGVDPVDNYEVRRNNIIYKDYQHNRNPFVDHPEFIIMIYDKNYSGPGALLDMNPGVEDPAASAANVVSMINKIGTVTLNSLSVIEAAEEAYAALSAEAKALVTNYAKLQEAREAYEELYETTIVSHVISMISSIGEVTLDDKATIEEAEKAYAKLTQTQKNQVTNYNVLVSAREQLNELLSQHEALNKILYEASFTTVTGVSAYNSYTFNMNGKSWYVENAYMQDTEFRLGHNKNRTVATKFATPLGLSSPDGSSLEMKFDVTNGKGIEFTFIGQYGTVSKLYILKSTDGGNTFTKCTELEYVAGTTTSISYEGEVDSKVRYAFVITGSKPRLILDSVKIKGVA